MTKFTHWDVEFYSDEIDMDDDVYENFDITQHFEKNGYIRVGSTDRTDPDSCIDSCCEYENALKNGYDEFVIVTKGCDDPDIEFWVK